jgi:hypothetical protein
MFSSLLEYLSDVPDCHHSHRVHCPLEEILFLMVSVLMSDCRDWYEIVNLGKDKIDWREIRLPTLHPCYE